MVRRKEATILIRWLETALNGAGLKAIALADDRALITAGLYDSVEKSFGSTDPAFGKILELMQRRVESFDPMLSA